MFKLRVIYWKGLYSCLLYKSPNPKWWFLLKITRRVLEHKLYRRTRRWQKCDECLRLFPSKLLTETNTVSNDHRHIGDQKSGFCFLHHYFTKIFIVSIKYISNTKLARSIVFCTSVGSLLESIGKYCDGKGSEAMLRLKEPWPPVSTVDTACSRCLEEGGRQEGTTGNMF